MKSKDVEVQRINTKVRTIYISCTVRQSDLTWHTKVEEVMREGSAELLNTRSNQWVGRVEIVEIPLKGEDGPINPSSRWKEKTKNPSRKHY